MDVETLAREFYAFRGQMEERTAAMQRDLDAIARANRNGRYRVGLYGAGGGAGAFALAQVLLRFLGLD